MERYLAKLNLQKKKSMSSYKQKPHNEETVIGCGNTQSGNAYIITEEQWAREDLDVDRLYITPQLCEKIASSTTLVLPDPKHETRKRYVDVVEYSHKRITGEHTTVVVLDHGETPYYFVTAYATSDGLNYKTCNGSITIGRRQRKNNGKVSVEQYKVRT